MPQKRLFLDATALVAPAGESLKVWPLTVKRRQSRPASRFSIGEQSVVWMIVGFAMDVYRCRPHTTVPDIVLKSTHLVGCDR